MIAWTARLVSLLEQLMPYLIVKKNEAELVVSFYKLRLIERGSARGRNAPYTEADWQFIEKWKKLRQAGR